LRSRQGSVKKLTKFHVTAPIGRLHQLSED
jgi:hypothetical protein